MSVMESQITGISIVYSIVCSGVDQRNTKAPCHSPLWGELTGDFPAQRANNAENVSVWWRHQGNMFHCTWYYLIKMQSYVSIAMSVINFKVGIMTTRRLQWLYSGIYWPTKISQQWSFHVLFFYRFHLSTACAGSIHVSWTCLLEKLCKYTVQGNLYRQRVNQMLLKRRWWRCLFNTSFLSWATSHHRHQ